MTDTTPHRATAEQWAHIENGVSQDAPWNSALVVLELRDRLAAAEQRISELEDKQDTQRVGMLDVYQHLDRLKIQHESNWIRIVKLEDSATCPHIVTSDEGTSYCGLAEQAASSQPTSNEPQIRSSPMDELREASADLQQTQILTPPPELVQKWWKDAQEAEHMDLPCWVTYAASRAAQWGAEAELDACCALISDNKWHDETKDLRGPLRAEQLRAARRPKPPRLAEEALRAHERSSFHYPGDRDTIRRALERLQQLEDQQ